MEYDKLKTGNKLQEEIKNYQRGIVRITEALKSTASNSNEDIILNGCSILKGTSSIPSTINGVKTIEVFANRMSEVLEEELVKLEKQFEEL